MGLIAQFIMSIVFGLVLMALGGVLSFIIGRKIDCMDWVRRLSRAIPDWLFLTIAIPACFVISFFLIYFFNF